MRLIVGLGNPGKQYEFTRHNLGFLVVRSFAEKHGLKFRGSSHFSGEVAGGQVGSCHLTLLLPMTYMNISGKAVKQCVDYYKIELPDILVVSDDINLPFGKLRFREEGGSGGHNGLKSIDSYLGTNKYPRLRVGIGDRDNGDLTDHVLGEFKQEEKEELPQVIQSGVDLLEKWLGESKE
ncbi:MAG: aminoacyl-tRNA hydrolase [Simkaniaceae bacterium]|nr:aminoacyl-tRNA hydrolase [Simkaniaceae bacterium]